MDTAGNERRETVATPLPEVDRVFIGWDHRQAVAYNVLHHSIISRASRPVSIAPLKLDTLPVTRTGLTPFTFSRFLVPWLCRFRGRAVFMDADMLVLGDICELFDLFDSKNAVQVVQLQERFEWGSMMLFNCCHKDNKKLTPDFVETTDVSLHKIGWTEKIGFLPSEWNHTVLYDEPRPDAKLVHFTGGIPLHPETKGCEYTEQWGQEARDMNTTQTWGPLMGHSVHARRVMQDRIRREVECAAE